MSPRIFPPILFFILLHFLSIEFAECAKILFTFYHDRGSHFGSMLPMMEKLALEGNSVHVLDTIFHADKSPLIRHIRATLPQEDEEPEALKAFQDFFWGQTDSAITLPEFFGHGDNLLAHRQHSVSVLYTISPSIPRQLAESNIRPLSAPLSFTEEYNAKVAPIIWNQTVDKFVVFMVWMEGHEQLADLMDSHWKKVAEIVDEDWDLIVMDDLFWCFGFALSTLKQRLWEKDPKRERAQPKSIVYATAGQTLLSAESIKATSRNWVSKVPLFPYIPTDSVDVYQPGRFANRLFAFYENFAEHLLMNALVEPFFLPNIARFGVPNFSWHEMYKRSALQYSDSIDRLGWPLAQGPEMINVGAHCKGPKAMPQQFGAFIDDPESKGTIYAAFGTYPDWNLAPGRILSALIGAFQRLQSYRIIFAYNGPPIPGLGKHIMLAKWAPQLEILAHPKTKAYITHGGLKSVREALCAGVPLIVMPLFAEQAHNAHLVLAMGIGPVINKYTLNADSVYGTIHGVVAKPESAERAARFRAIFLDRPMPALDEGAFWVDRLMRLRPGRRANFVRKGMDLDWLQFAYIDWALCILGIIALLK